MFLWWKEWYNRMEWVEPYDEEKDFSVLFNRWTEELQEVTKRSTNNLWKIILLKHWSSQQNFLNE